MKFLETHFDEYINANKKQSLHPKLNKLYSSFPNKVCEFKNLIFYGPKGVGKYTQMLTCIKKYSPTELKYEKRFSIAFDKKQYFFKISDIHFEVDMSLLGCNSKLLWNEVYNQIVDVITARTEPIGIIVCKNFHKIHSELLEIFHSYMQNVNKSVQIKYILITEEMSFIHDSILNCCEIINTPRPTKTAYNKCLVNKIGADMKLEDIGNIKNLHTMVTQLTNPHEIICNKIIDNILNPSELKFLNFRDILYDIFIYDLDITTCIWYILCHLIREKIIKDDISDILIKTYSFLQYFNNNYRPIYHLESYMFFLISKIHGYKFGT